MSAKNVTVLHQLESPLKKEENCQHFCKSIFVLQYSTSIGYFMIW